MTNKNKPEIEKTAIVNKITTTTKTLSKYLKKHLAIPPYLMWGIIPSFVRAFSLKPARRRKGEYNNNANNVIMEVKGQDAELKEVIEGDTIYHDCS